MTEKGHHVFCSAAGWPCGLHCEDWPEDVHEMFPNMEPKLADELQAHVEEWWSGNKRNGEA